MRNQISDSQGSYEEFTTWKEKHFILGEFLHGEWISVCCQVSGSRYLLQVRDKNCSDYDSAWFMYDVKEQSLSVVDVDKMLSTRVYELEFRITAKSCVERYTAKQW